jgi:hypothetical protein
MFDLTYMKGMELGWKENQRIQNTGIEDCQGDIINSRSKRTTENLE